MNMQALSRAGWQSLGAELGRRPGPLWRLAGWSLLEVLPTAASGFVVARAVDQGFVRGDAAVGVAWLGGLAVLMLVGAVGARQTFGSLADVVEPLRDAVLGAVAAGAIRRAAAGVERPSAGAVGQLTGQVEAVREMTAALLMTVRRFAFTAVATLVGITALAPALLVAVLPPLVVALVLFWWLLRGVAPRSRTVILAGEATSTVLGTMVGGVRDTVASGAERRASGEAGAVIAAQAVAERRLAKVESARVPAVAVGAQLPVILLLVAAPWLVGDGLVTPGELLGAITYITTGLAPMLAVLVQGIGAVGVQLGVVLHRLHEASREPPLVLPADPRTPRGHDIEVRGLTFAYGVHADPVVRGFDLTIPPDEHLVVVGPSGIGKSTLANLMTGMATPQAGTVRLGGVDLQHVAPEERHRRLALIPQEAYVFAGTVGENLTYLRPDATAAELDATCATMPPLADLVARLGGHDAPLVPAALSAGERQLIALGRVHLSAADVVLLDEATCYLDPAAEELVEHAFHGRRGTLVIVAHRISSALRADRILLLDGMRAHLGTHQELLANSPLYADLVGHWA
jgi:ATP-binding cassette subfamily C protein